MEEIEKMVGYAAIAVFILLAANAAAFVISRLKSRF